MDSGPVLVLVTGLQGSGKSSVSDGLGDRLGAPVFAWDWFMGALTPFDALRDALRAMDRDTYRAVGWALMLQTARAQLRHGRSVVLDSIARDDEITAVRALAREHGARSVVVLTTCTPQTQRERIEGRSRGIPGWHELTWEHVKGTRARWTPPSDIDVELDETGSVDEHVATVLRLLA